MAARRKHASAAHAGGHRPFDETKVRREGGRFADKPGAGDDEGLGDVKTSGLTRNDRIESLSDTADRLDGRTIGEVLDDADDPMAALRSLTQRHRKGEIQFREGGPATADDRLDIQEYLGTRYRVEHEEVFHQRDDQDDIEFEDFLEAKTAKAPSDAIVLMAEIRSKRGRTSASDMEEEMVLSFDTPRNRPGFLGGEVGEIENLAVADAAREYAQANAKLYGKDYDGGFLLVTIRRPDDSPYWPARRAAEARFRRDGLSEEQIQEEVTGVADIRRANARAAADNALSDKRRADTDAKLREAYGAAAADFSGLSGRDLFIRRDKLIRQYAKERGVTLPYA